MQSFQQYASHKIDFKALSLHKDYPLVWELSKNFFIFESGLESWIDRESWFDLESSKPRRESISKKISYFFIVHLKP